MDQEGSKPLFHAYSRKKQSKRECSKRLAYAVLDHSVRMCVILLSDGNIYKQTVSCTSSTAEGNNCRRHSLFTNSTTAAMKRLMIALVNQLCVLVENNV